MPGSAGRWGSWILTVGVLAGIFYTVTGKFFNQEKNDGPCRIRSRLITNFSLSLSSISAALDGHTHMDNLSWKSKQGNSSGTSQDLLIQSVQSKDQANRSHHAKGALSRRKRDLLFLNGVKLCSQETVQQAMDNHLHYFHLRGKIAVPSITYIFPCHIQRCMKYK